MNLTKEDRISLNRRNIICDAEELESVLSIPPNNEIITRFLPYFDEYMSLRIRELDRPWFPIMDGLLGFFLILRRNLLDLGFEGTEPLESLATNFLLAIGEEV